jgi:predicted DNA-binding protein with PD1-like motif
MKVFTESEDSMETSFLLFHYRKPQASARGGRHLLQIKNWICYTIIMKIVLQQENQYVLRFDRGEEVINQLLSFCKQEKIVSGFFVGLGACSFLKLASYNLEAKKYEEKEFSQDLEIGNLTGNIAHMDGELIAHMHGNFSDANLKAIAGHVMLMKVGGTCEIMFTKFDQPMNRNFDTETGLKLLD